MRKVIVTGGLGFIGSNLIEILLNKKFSVINIDKVSYSSNFYNTKNFEKKRNYKLIKCDIGNKIKIRQILSKYKPLVIFNLAAETHVDRSIDKPKNFIESNIVSTFNFIDEFKNFNIKFKNTKFIHISTDEVYGESLLSENEEKKTEHSILCPTNPYAATKAGAELIAGSYRHSFNMPIIITRGNNVFGPNQYPEKLIPRFIDLLKNDKKVTIQGDGSNVRAFLHASDVAGALECILEKGKVGEIYNIGSDEDKEYTVLEIAQMLIKIIKKTDDYDNWITYIEDRPFNDLRYYISNEKVRKLGWEIKKDFMEGLMELIETDNNFCVKKNISVESLSYI